MALAAGDIPQRFLFPRDHRIPIPGSNAKLVIGFRMAGEQEDVSGQRIFLMAFPDELQNGQLRGNVILDATSDATIRDSFDKFVQKMNKPFNGPDGNPVLGSNPVGSVLREVFDGEAPTDVLSLLNSLIQGIALNLDTKQLVP